MASDVESSDAYLTADSQSARDSSPADSRRTFSRDASPATALTDALNDLTLRAPRSESLPNLDYAPAASGSIAPQRVRVLVQDACRLHRYLRTSDDATIVERPQRLRALNMGVAAAWARGGGDAALALAAQVDRIALNGGAPTRLASVRGAPFDVVASSAKLSIRSPTVAAVHDKPNEPPHLPVALSSSPTKAAFPSPPYPVQLADWTRDAAAANASGKSEVPAHLPQGDLYWSAGSLDAVEGALGTSCEAVDEVMAEDAIRFAAIRPPGHHCAASTPSGFCLVNNVLVAAQHAHERHNVDRVVIFDIDLHHGDGTQSIVQRINAESEVAARASPRKQSPRKGHVSPRNRRSPSPQRGRAMSEEPVIPVVAPLPTPLKRPLKLLYTSLHDIASFPCEDGDEARVAAASMCINGGHGQHVWNVHLEEYSSESDFHQRLYPSYRSALFDATTSFLRKTHADPDRTLFIISSGFDASEHEYPSMQRHGKRVPTSFYARIASDLRALAAEQARSRLVAILEGGYSDRALASGVASLLDGFTTDYGSTLPWDVKTLIQLERACDPTSTTRSKTCEPWMATAQAVFSAIEGVTLPGLGGAGTTSTAPTTPMALRERKPRLAGAMASNEAETPPKPVRKTGRAVSAAASRARREDVGEAPPPLPLPPPASLLAVSSSATVEGPSTASVPNGGPTAAKDASGRIRFVWRAGEQMSATSSSGEEGEVKVKREEAK